MEIVLLGSVGSVHYLCCSVRGIVKQALSGAVLVP